MYCITIYTNSSTFVKCQESLFLGSFHEPSQNTGTFSIGIQGNYKFPFYTEQIKNTVFCYSDFPKKKK